MSKVINRVLGGGGSGYYPSASFRAEDFDENGSVTLSGQGKTYNAIWKRNAVRLPSAYQEVEYIQSTGTQYIDTEVLVTDKTRFIIDVMPLDAPTSTASATKTIFGTHTTNKRIGINNYKNTTYQFFYTNGSGNTDYNANLVKNTRGTISYIGNILTQPDGSTLSITQPITFVGLSIYLFAFNNNGTTSFYGNNKLYSFSLYDDTTIVRNFIPCYRKSDSVIGLYDLVNDQFYTNSGTGTFLMGRPINALPQGYQEVEYIQSSGSQYIDTNVLASSTIGIESTFVATQISTSGWIYGAKNGEYRYGLSITSAGKFETKYGALTTTSISGAINTTYNTAFNIGERKLIVNNSSATYNDGTLPTAFSIWLFAYNNDGVIGNAGYYKLNNLKIYDNLVLVRNYIPCYRTSDNEIGLYDIVNGVFYANDGTGTFAKGENVITGYFDIEKINKIGTYTCVATQGAKTKTETILIDLPTHYDIEIVLPTYLYNLGDECTSLTGGWIFNKVHRATLGTCSKQSNYMLVSCVATSSELGSFAVTSSTINLSNYSKLCLIYSVNNTSSVTNSSIVMSSFLTSSSATSHTEYIEIGRDINEFDTQYTIERDISSISTTSCICLGNTGNLTDKRSINIYRVWLE